MKEGEFIVNELKQKIVDILNKMKINVSDRLLVITDTYADLILAEVDKASAPPVDGGDREALDALAMVLPMAKAHAHAHPVGANQSKCDHADAVLARHATPDGEKTEAAEAFPYQRTFDAIATATPPVAARPHSDAKSNLSESDLAQARTWLDGSYGETCKRIAEALLTAK